MRVSGFTFIKNAIIYDYPIVESIRSILPICDEVVVAVGKSDDETLELIQSIDSKVKIIETEWDESLREGGKVLALETDKAFAAISKESDWAFYIQGDEVVHEKYLENIKEAMLKHKNNPKVDGLLFKYEHFYGSYDYVGASTSWYSHEIRIVKNDPTVRSFRDAQGFRIREDEILKVIPIDAYIYHYGWVKQPEAMQKKQENFNKLWHDDNWINENVISTEQFDYAKGMKELKKFEGTHPKIIQPRIEKMNWKFDQDLSLVKRKRKDKIKDLLLKLGINSSYQNYKIVKP